MFVLMFWILVIECMTVEIKVVYGTDRVIITIPVHGKKTHHTRTVYKIVEKPGGATGPRTNRRPQTTGPAEPDGDRPLGWYGGGEETAQDADAGSHEARRQTATAESRGRAAGPYRSHAVPYAHKPRVIHVVGKHKHGHYADVMYVGRHRPGGRLRGPPKHAYPATVARHKHPSGAGGDRARKPPRRGAPGRAAPVRFRPAAPVVVPPPPQLRRPHAQDPGGGYQVQEESVADDDRLTARDPLPYITVGPAEAAQQHSAFAAQQAAFAAQQAAFAAQQAASAAPPHTAVSHVYYTLDPVVPYDDVPRRPNK